MRYISNIVICMHLLCGGCVGVGQANIREGRLDYNDAIHDTSATQLLLNIIRVNESEAPLFLDVSEVDASSNLQTSITGGPSMIGSATGAIGMLTGAASYSDAPIVKYAPLTGNPLIQQVSLPVSLGSISKLEISDFPTTPLFTVSFNRISPAYLDYYRVIDTIAALDMFGAISSDASADDRELYLRFNPNGNLSRKYAREAGDEALQCAPPHESAAVTTRRLWLQLQQIYGQEGQKITLGTALSKAKKYGAVSPRSALGAIINAGVFTGDPDEIERIMVENRNSPCHISDFYYINKQDESIKSLWKQHFEAVFYENNESEKSGILFRKLGHRRYFLLLQKTSIRPVDCFVSVFRKGFWFSVRSDDTTSKANLSLFNQILTIQAVPNAPTQPTQTAIVRP